MRVGWLIPGFAALGVLVALLAQARDPQHPPLDPLTGLVLPGVTGSALGIAVVALSVVMVGRGIRFRERHPNAVIAPVIDVGRTLAEFGAALGHPTPSGRSSPTATVVADHEGIALWSTGSNQARLVGAAWSHIGDITVVPWAKPVGYLYQQMSPRFCLRFDVMGQPVSMLAQPVVAGAQLTGGRPDEADIIAFVDRVRAQRPHP